MYVAWVAFEVVFVYFLFPETSNRTLEELSFRKNIRLVYSSIPLLTIHAVLLQYTKATSCARNRRNASKKRSSTTSVCILIPPKKLRRSSRSKSKISTSPNYVTIHCHIHHSCTYLPTYLPIHSILVLNALQRLKQSSKLHFDTMIQLRHLPKLLYARRRL